MDAISWITLLQPLMLTVVYIIYLHIWKPSDVVADTQLREFDERLQTLENAVERLEKQAKQLTSDINDMYSSAIQTQNDVRSDVLSVDKHGPKLDGDFKVGICLVSLSGIQLVTATMVVMLWLRLSKIQVNTSKTDRNARNKEHNEESNSTSMDKSNTCIS